jgi:hypothetical protein
MPSLAQMKWNISGLLMEPRPIDRQLFHALTRECQSFTNRLSNTSKAWDTGEWDLRVTANAGEYEVGDSRFGKPLSVTTADPGDPGHYETPVDFFEVQNLSFDWNLPNDFDASANVGGSNHSALRMAFFRKDNQWRVRVRPVPQASALYRVLFSVGPWADDADMATVPGLAEHHGLIEERTALRLLPYCRWWDEEKENRERRKELAVSIRLSEQRHTAELDEYVESMTPGGLSFRPGPCFD